MSAHQPFWRGFATRIGPPVFAATLVACLLTREFNPLHIGLLAIGYLERSDNKSVSLDIS